MSGQSDPIQMDKYSQYGLPNDELRKAPSGAELVVFASFDLNLANEALMRWVGLVHASDRVVVVDYFGTVAPVANTATMLPSLSHGFNETLESIRNYEGARTVFPSVLTMDQLVSILDRFADLPVPVALAVREHPENIAALVRDYLPTVRPVVIGVSGVPDVEIL